MNPWLDDLAVEVPSDGVADEGLDLVLAHRVEPATVLLAEFPDALLAREVDAAEIPAPAERALLARQLLLARVGGDADELALLARDRALVVLHEPGHEREQRVVPACGDVLPGVERRPALSDEDVAGDNGLACVVGWLGSVAAGERREDGRRRTSVLLDAEPLSDRVAPVLGRTSASFCGCSHLHQAWLGVGISRGAGTT